MSLRWLFRLGMWVSIFVYLFSYFGQYSLVAELLSNLRTQFLFLFWVLLLLTSFAKAGRPLVLCLMAALVVCGWGTGRLFLSGNQPPAGDVRIRVMSYNVLTTNNEFQNALNEIRDHDPDIVAILEYANMWHEACDVLNETWPHQHRDPRWHGYGIAIFSKLPLDDVKAVPLTEDTLDNPAASVTVRVDGQPIRVMATHVMSPVNQLRLGLRNRQFEEIAGYINSDSIETMLVGDMNCSTASPYLSKLINDTGLRDSRQGFGPQPTWPTYVPGFARIPIDHVFVSKSIHIHDRFLGDANGSDHRPVIVDVSISRK